MLFCGRAALSAVQRASQQQRMRGVDVRVFISHSSQDFEVASLLVDLFQRALGLSSEDIRCTSVDGYGMPAGVTVDERLRDEVHEAELLIGVITPNSLKSAYVMFELGARWGAEKAMIPLLASGTTPSDMGGPLAGINALDGSKDAQVQQLLEESAGYLGVVPGRASTYTNMIRELVQKASAENVISTEVYESPSAFIPLSDDAWKLLRQAADDPNATIISTRTVGDLFVETNNIQFVESRNARSAARWRQALADLEELGLVVDEGSGGQIYRVTQRGFKLVDAKSE